MYCSAIFSPLVTFDRAEVHLYRVVDTTCSLWLSKIATANHNNFHFGFNGRFWVSKSHFGSLRLDENLTNESLSQ